ncbi:hypothetical protein BU24DRAFT_158843 [Aaosphaeria arxii CBS 175.79]|uniref:Glucose-inducible SAM-dependent methyltransferase Rrg1 n=1 Tax=Aaosphaeria arxii CBS 175.79 TaxID=1450172 RepID=A0A6A5XXV1_9PLEO|nr:uncharacterized protein BU24DRAFT_158843 [Aaosphaeria arxii CBS 175.79]KAF2017786.1 hypothetical protein BU24DRAFT_158843 [Aaosphaeria arxii CBS 175.79]
MTLLDVLDLPQLYTKPSADALLETLALLTSTPPSWETSDVHDRCNGDSDSAQRREQKSAGVNINPEGVTRYLTSIVASSLKWIQDEQVKEEIWNQASLRLSERSGRTAMGALSRNFTIPTSNGPFELTIHEPALTGDDLGLKTWAASYLLAKRLHTLSFIPHKDPSHFKILELGSGTGLVGLAMAALGTNVVLTDLPSIHANLARNVKDNAETVSSAGGSAKSGVLDWTKPDSLRLFPDEASMDDESITHDSKFPFILAADSLYSPEHPRWLVDTIATWLSDDEEAKVMVEFPLRDAYLPEVADFRNRMGGIGLHILEEGEESGLDDWGSSNDDDRTFVTCWYALWGRTAKK